MPPAPPEPEREAPALRVGLFGGSFNPAHAGHLYVSLEALKRLRLDQVWWLVSPQNPLKAAQGMASLAERLAGARAVARHPRIKVTALESRLGTRYTADTLARLGAWPGHRFVWLMGADNLAQLPRWKKWRGILSGCPVAVFERHPYSYQALAGPVARAFAPDRLAEDRAEELPMHPPPAWVFVRIRPHPASATAIRAERRAVVG
ncbi:MAG: nicotinate-nucleotide adenylyltransferase [Geminicoccaceae bacterium]